MRDHKLPATTSHTETGDAARRAGLEPAARRVAGSTRTVGVYERPARRAGLSLPLIVLMILAALVSVVMTARFLF